MLSDIPRLREHLSNLFGGTSLWGMAFTTKFIEKDSPYGQSYFSVRCRDALISLAEALAVRNILSNQQTSLKNYIRSMNCDLAPVLIEVEAALGHSLEPPQLGGPPVAECGGRYINPDSIRHAYIMHRVQQIGIKKESPILEIGGGFATVARYAYLRGFRNYTIIDLPFANAIQAAFIAESFGEDVVSLHGEEARSFIRLVPSNAKSTLEDNYELAINMDSLPEIEEAIDYIKLIKSRAKNFLSVNQEAALVSNGFEQRVVSSMVSNVGGFNRVSRHNYWMEQGYAEELYTIPFKD